jgi:two-component system cell cycle sensor histidine kinase/response regulator CckA
MAAVIANVDVAVRELGRLADAQTGMRGLLVDVVDALHDAGDAAGRVQQIVRDLRTLSRSDDERQAPVDVRRTLESSLRIAWNEIRHRARVVRNYQDVPTVDGNESRLGQVFINLLVNAAQAIPEGNAEHNQIVVATRVDGDSVVIEISDTGEGFAPDRMQRVFEPFYTTKPEGIGTGLGMFICQGIVTGMGGDISVAATSSQGRPSGSRCRAASWRPAGRAPRKCRWSRSGVGPGCW